MWAVALALAGDILVADFEGSTYGAWTTTGTAFGQGPAEGTLPNQMAVSGYKGKRLVNSFNGGDATTGTLTSPQLKVQRRYITFLIGGGKDLEKTCVRLKVEGKVVRTATGPNDKPGGSEALRPAYWDVREFLAKNAVVEVIDNATGGWGHVNLDHIVQTDTKPPVAVPLVKRTFTGSGRYLNLPIKDGAPLKRVKLLMDGKLVVANNIGLADDKPDWWAPMDLGDDKGPVTLEVQDALETVLKPVTRTAKPKGMEGLYQEKLRGQFHFSPARGWTNDPNGMVYYKGEYHLFFQHNPYGWAWENMHWGHAVSKDMHHWTELPDALAPDSLGTIFSGSAVVDKEGTAGFGKGAQVLIYTAAGDKFTQCLAYSTDGRHYTKYAGNPVLPEITNGNRDPKVMWYEPTKRWIMSLYVEEGGKHKIVFFSSPNLKQWKREGEVEGFFECPDLFPLALDGDRSNTKWILTAASSEYMVGSFDGHTFVPETPKLTGHRGKGFYAAQTFDNMPDGRRVQIGWFQTETRGMPFNQAMSLPNELNLRSTSDGPRLAWSPIREMKSLLSLSSDETSMPPVVHRPQSETILVDTVFEPTGGESFARTVDDLEIVYDAKTSLLKVWSNKATEPPLLPNPVRAPLVNGRMHLMIYIDRASVEIYASDGLVYIPLPYETEKIGQAFGAVLDGRTKIVSDQVFNVASIWPKPPQPKAKSKS